MRNPNIPRPLFGRRMGEYAPQEEEREGAPSLLSDVKARDILRQSQESAPSVEKEEGGSLTASNGTVMQETFQNVQEKQEHAPIASASENVQKDMREKEAAMESIPASEPRARAVHRIHFGMPPKEDAPRSDMPDEDDEATTREIPRRMKRRVERKKSPHPFLSRLWNLFFSDTSFKKDVCLMPKASPGFDRIFLLAFIVLLGIGSVMVFSSSYAYAEARYNDSTYFVRRQIIFAVLGVGVMLVASMLTVDFYRMITRVSFGITVFLLVLVPVIGINLNGAKRWIGFGPITVQPTEIAKLTMVMMLAYYFEKHGHKMKEKTSFIRHFCYNTAFPFIFIGVICVLVMLQKHLSGIIILGTIGIIVMFIAGTDGRYLGTLIGGAGVGVACIAIFTDYTKRRIDIWQDPYAMRLDGGWQTIQGLNAIGSGGFLGLGIGDSRMKYSWVSEPANEFIFTITCEELGFVGAFVILCFFALFVWRGYVIAMRNPNTFAKLLCIGIISKVAVQTLLNLAVITNTIPNTGIPLPFFSYGGTSLVIQLLEVGIVLSISRTSNLSHR